MTSQPLIGVLSGVDQKSAAPFIDAFITLYEKPFLTKGEIEIPHIIVNALPVTCLESVPQHTETTQAALLAALKLLEKAGSTCIVLNSYVAHMHVEALRTATSLPIIDMVSTSIAHIKKAPYKVAILGTRTTLATHIFQDALTQIKSEGIMPPYWQTHVDAMLKKMRVGLSAQTEFSWLLGRIKSSGITTLIIASTELSKMASRATGFTVIDANLLLAEATVKHYREVTK